LELFGADHLAALAATAALAVALVVVVRLRPLWTVAVSRGLAVALAVSWAVEHAAFVVRGTSSLEYNLPLHLTDVVNVVKPIALRTARPFLVELVYVWALSASLQAVLTPNLHRGADSISFWTFFLTHSTAVIAALVLTIGRGIHARQGVARVYVATVTVAALTAVGDLATGGNYMFLREKPDTGSLLDLFGPSAWHIAGGAAVGLAIFLLLDAPFRGERITTPPAAAQRAR
jgi:hypothetical integral membrane protein (TIGR02206 family)